MFLVNLEEFILASFSRNHLDLAWTSFIMFRQGFDDGFVGFAFQWWLGNIEVQIAEKVGLYARFFGISVGDDSDFHFGDHF